MSSAHDSSGAPDGGAGRPARLVRTRRGRLIGGVCSGLGAHFGIDPLLLRIAFVGLAFFAGAGFWLYLAILLLVPEEGASRAPIRLGRSSWELFLGAVVVIVALGVLIPVISRHALGSAWGLGVGVGALALIGIVAASVWLRLRGRDRVSADVTLVRNLALVLAVICALLLVALAGAWLEGVAPHAAAWAALVVGIVLVLAAFTGGGRRLVAPALTFVLAIAVFAAARVDLHGGLGERVYRPRTLSELRHEYRLGAGKLEVDLRNISFPAGQTSLRVRLGVGELVVIVPRGVCALTRAHIGGGFVGALEDRAGGLDVAWRAHAPTAPSTPILKVEGDVGLGALLVTHHPLTGGYRAGEYGSNEACFAGERVAAR